MGVAISGWTRLAIVEALQLPAIALVLVSEHHAAWWVAALWGSLTSCAGTDSGWRWTNRALVLQAIAWLTLAAVFGWQGDPTAINPPGE